MRHTLFAAGWLGCALAAGAAPAPAAESLGRLFFSPEQRSTLDTLRSKKTRVVLETETPNEKPPPAPTPEVVTYGGIVRRSDGNATVWINNRAIEDKDVRSGSTIVGRVRPDGSVSVQSSQSGRAVDLKVGQRAELLSGSVEEGYARRNLPGSQKPEEKSEIKPESKPEAKPAGNTSPAAQAAAAERARDERDREDRTDNALKALEGAAAKAAPQQQPTPPQPSR